MRPDVGTQAQFRKKKPPKTYRYDSSLSPSLAWDGQNGARELGEWLLALIERAARPGADVFAQPQAFSDVHGAVLVTIHSLEEALAHLKRLSAPFLNWAGKAERLSLDVPTLPLFVHERGRPMGGGRERGWPIRRLAVRACENCRTSQGNSRLTPDPAAQQASGASLDLQHTCRNSVRRLITRPRRSKGPPVKRAGCLRCGSLCHQPPRQARSTGPDRAEDQETR
jgi:hypothetical protein